MVNAQKFHWVENVRKDADLLKSITFYFQLGLERSSSSTSIIKGYFFFSPIRIKGSVVYFNLTAQFAVFYFILFPFIMYSGEIWVLFCGCWSNRGFFLCDVLDCHSLEPVCYESFFPKEATYFFGRMLKFLVNILISVHVFLLIWEFSMRSFFGRPLKYFFFSLLRVGGLWSPYTR